MRKDIEDQEICMEKKDTDLWKKGVKLSSEGMPSRELAVSCITSRTSDAVAPARLKPAHFV